MEAAVRRSVPRRRARRLLAGAAALAAAAGSLAVATPALACSCNYRNVDASVAEGHTVAIVRGDPKRSGAYLVERSTSPALPARVRPKDVGTGCGGVSVEPGRLAALVLERRAGSADWVTTGCAEARLAPALHRVLGDAAAVDGGAAVAYVAGGFGSSRLAGLDRSGQIVAVDSRPGDGMRVAVCPGGKAVAAVGLTAAPERPTRARGDRRYELTVHSAGDLRVRRTVVLPMELGDQVLALRCADANGRRAEVVVAANDTKASDRMLSVDGAQVDIQQLDEVQAAAPVPGGMLVATGWRSPSLLLLTPAGTRTVAVLDGVQVGPRGFAVSPDGRTAAVAVYRDGGPSPLLTMDLRTGERLGEWPGGPYVTGLAWTGPDRLVVRAEVDSAVRTPLRAFDRELTPLGDSAPVATGSSSGELAAVGPGAVVYGEGARLTAVPPSGAPLVVDSLRLAAAAHVVGRPGGAFDAGAPGSDPYGVADGFPTGPFLAALAALGVATGAAPLLLARRRTRARG
jgi:hypothetical protein